MIVFLLVLLLVVGLIFIKNEKFTEGPEDYNIIIIAVTNIGADHLGTYGYERNTSPNIDIFAKGSIVFDNFFTPASWTLPTGISLFTSLYPYQHKVMNRIFYDNQTPIETLDPSTITLVDLLKDDGYITGAFTGGFDYRNFFGLTNRFDFYYDSEQENLLKNLVNAKFLEDRKFGSIVDIMPKAVEWIEKNKGQKFFLFLQGYDTHCPFTPKQQFDELFVNFSTDNLKVHPGYCYRGYDNNGTYFSFTTNIVNSTKEKVFTEVKLSKTDLDFLEAQYDAEIRYVDNYIGRFIYELKERDVLDKTIVILLSEHGEMFAKHGRFGRAGTVRGTLYDDVIHVPLIIRHPELEPKRISKLIQMIDVMPTLLDFVGIPIPKNIEGKSLTPLIYNNTGINKEIYGGSVYGSLNFPYYQSETINEFVRIKDFKLIHEIALFPNGSREEKYELYDISTDKGEQKNIINKKIELADKLKKKLTEWSQNMSSAPELEII